MRLFIVLLIFTYSPFLTAQSSVKNIETHFAEIVNTEKYRNYRNIETLDSIADYLKKELEKYADSTYFQNYIVDGKTYKNVVAVYKKKNAKTIVIGAHYDVCGDQDGADDNASGVIAILEMARMFKDNRPEHRIELVCFTLEEPPFFRTQNMGSYQHAKSLSESKRDVYGVIALDMIGYFAGEKKTQSYPIKPLSLWYGSRGNFIMLVNKWGKGKFARKFSRKFKHQKSIKVKRLTGPKSIEGLDWSDHLNYWTFGYSASMITDTSFYRNKNYHNKGDTIETIDIPKMAKVIDGIFNAILNL